MVTVVHQQDSKCCALACIESLSVDKCRPKSQQELIDAFPAWCHKGQWREHKDGHRERRDGETSPYAFFQILRELQLASTFEVGIGRAFVEKHSKNIDDGVFLHTTNHPDGTPEGYHCWRLENVLADGFVVMDPAQQLPRFYVRQGWEVFERRGCVVIVCVP